ncbi:poly(ADP-ribose) glycohydrolase ARH3 [Pelobates cultripes]|uniref:ADP-ribosylhydrolase ARH3 n=1 Tax=Pelobates cultripes TaxID=61616 RepID=A0AAD1R2C1_PELCU|nr:poly(ADP-ribose) glycohydrolase ARH3 [Pelobates cultripes]
MAVCKVSSFRGALLGALLGDCLGAVFEGLNTTVRSVCQFLDRLDKRSKEGKDPLMYTDDTAMARSIIQSVLANKQFDTNDLAERFTEEYKNDPHRGYGMAVVHVFEKIDSGEYDNVFIPAKEQFDGRGSYGNGAAMRVVGIPLAYPSIQDTIKYAKLSGQLTHASSLGYNGGILQALAVHYALQGEQSKDTFLQHLLDHMQEVESDEKSCSDARALELGEFPFCNKLKKIKEFLEKGNVSQDNVVEELGNGIAALESVPTAIYSFLRCMDPVEELPQEYNNLQRTIAFCISLGGDTDTIATMAGAIAGAYYGEEQVPLSWKLCSEAYQDAELWGEKLHQLYSTRMQSSGS